MATCLYLVLFGIITLYWRGSTFFKEFADEVLDGPEKQREKCCCTGENIS
jgi:hypothetical protein